MNKNNNLTNAKREKNNEFYTMLSDIENELKYYRDQFRGKVMYCNCDDARDSQFFTFFSLNFEFLGLKKLICTGYKEDGHGVVLVYEGDKNGNKRVDKEEIKVTELNGNGDFRSEECVKFLKESDIVVTNPPFSLFRQYIKQLMDYGKKFLVIGNSNAFTYKEIFPYIKNGEIRTGKNYVKEFKQPDGSIKKFGNVCWFTNLKTHKADNPFQIINRYYGNEDEYPHYDNYDAINVDKLNNFPYDLPIGQVVGVPITIVDKIADDGLIYFDDCGMADGVQKYDVKGLDRYVEDNPNYGHRFKIGGGQVQTNPYQAYRIIDAKDIAKTEKLKMKNTYLIKDKDSAIKGNPKYARIVIKRIR